MTKYILHGGNIRTSADGGKAFFEEIVKDLGPTPRLLLCFFALPPGTWEEKYHEWEERIKQGLKTCEPVFDMATINHFEHQAKQCDALFIYGGDDDLLIAAARQTTGFIKSLKTLKVVAGSSAGAMLLASQSWGCDKRAVRQGLGIVPLYIMVHYGSSYGATDPLGPIDWEKAEQELRHAIGPGKHIIHLPEGRFTVVS